MKNHIASPITIALCLSLVASCSPRTEKQAPPSPEKDSAPSETASDAFNPDKVVFEGPGQKLRPRFGKWTLTSAPRYFGPDTLYDLINGGSEIFIEFGFTRIATADYRIGTEPRSITIEIYHMGTPMGAFGRVARYLENFADPSKAGDKLPAAIAPFGIMGDGDLRVWKAEYIVHLTLIDESAEATPESIAADGVRILPEIASQILANIDGTAALPEELQKLPAENRIARSEAWHPAHVAGVAELRDGFSARYTDASGAGWGLFFTTEYPGAEDAGKAAEAALKNKDAGIASVKVKGSRVYGALREGEKSPDPAALKTALAALEASL